MTTGSGDRFYKIIKFLGRVAGKPTHAGGITVPVTVPLSPSFGVKFLYDDGLEVPFLKKN